jgi:acyl carrier protein
MSTEQISEQVKTIFRQVFKGESGLVLNENTSSNDIVSWNSLSHVILIDTIEKHFDIKFDLDAMLSMETFGEICCETEKRINAK